MQSSLKDCGTQQQMSCGQVVTVCGLPHRVVDMGGGADSRRHGREAGLPDYVLRKIVNAHFRWRDEHDRMMVYYMGLAKRDERLIPTKHL